jgi:hypothetical protein
MAVIAAAMTVLARVALGRHVDTASGRLRRVATGAGERSQSARRQGRPRRRGDDRPGGNAGVAGPRPAPMLRPLDWPSPDGRSPPSLG